MIEYVTFRDILMAGSSNVWPVQILSYHLLYPLLYEGYTCDTIPQCIFGVTVESLFFPWTLKVL